MFVISEPEIISNLKSALAKVGFDVTNRLFVFDHRSDHEVPSELQSWKALQGNAEEDWTRFNDEQVQTITTAGYFFTSGTTGLPKCAMISHRNLIAAHEIFWKNMPRKYKITCAHVFPFFHVGVFPSIVVSTKVHTSEACWSYVITDIRSTDSL